MNKYISENDDSAIWILFVTIILALIVRMVIYEAESILERLTFSMDVDDDYTHLYDQAVYDSNNIYSYYNASESDDFNIECSYYDTAVNDIDFSSYSDSEDYDNNADYSYSYLHDNVGLQSSSNTNHVSI